MIDKALIPVLSKLRVPKRYSLDQSAAGFLIRRLASPPMVLNATFAPYKNRGHTCRRVIATTDQGENIIVEFARFTEQYEPHITTVINSRRPSVDGELLVLDDGRYSVPPREIPVVEALRDQVHSEWSEGIAYRTELVDDSGELQRTGFRLPQAGALHAIASHWTLGRDPAIVVMPTGTGKTEVMIAASVAAACHRLLVIVPTDALREQTANKFETYGLLRDIGVLASPSYPVIGLLASRPTRAHFDFIRACNVVVTTMSSIGLADTQVQEEFAALFSHVFFDEAHHVEAASWKKFQKHCQGIPSLLFTATPFRQDGKPLEGKIIYNFPLSDAQSQGYFNPIHFTEVFEPDEDSADRAIADVAVAQLRQDDSAGHDHILMARAGTIAAAKKLFDEIYYPVYGDLNPVLIHSATRRKRSVVQAIREGRHRIVVCVDMFGEGFDLPNLKIAALHTVHKSLGVTLQFIGRFARTSSHVGQATFVANTAEDGVPEALERLYQEDADWNLLVADLSYDAIDPQARLSELVANLAPVRTAPEEAEISTLALRPKISARVYRTKQFYPDRFAEAFTAKQHIHQPRISRSDNMLVLVVNQQEPIDWTDSRQIALDSWDLYIAYFDPVKNLLYVHSSRKGQSTGKLAETISDNPLLIQGEEVFKSFARLRRLTLHSVGLSSRSRNVRYQMFAGLDVRNAIDPVQQQSKMKSNVTGVGYEEGARQSVGCSRKGKVWSMTSGSLAQWRRWCDDIGGKLSDAGTRPDDFLKYTLVPTIINELPEARALMVDWPDQLFESSHFHFQVRTPDRSFDFHDCELRLLEWQARDCFKFALRAGEEIETQLSLHIDAHGESESTYRVQRSGGANFYIEAAGQSWDVTEFFNNNPPLVRLEDGSQLSGNILLKPREEMGEVFDRGLIEVLDWAGTDLSKESRWKNGQVRHDSIQQRFIEHLSAGAASFVIDDDDQGESADIVTIEEAQESITVFLWHCKYSSGTQPGHRVGDLYEVCGQAQKSVKWTWSLDRLIKHLIVRESKYCRGRRSRFIRGSTHDLATLRKAARRKFVRFRIGIVQPGLSKATIPPDHLAIIGSTSSFVQCITDNPLLVVGSP